MTDRRKSPRPFELDPALAPRLIEEQPADLVPLPEPAPEATAPERPRWRKRLAALFGIGTAGLVTVQAIDYVGGLLATDPWLGWPMAAFMALFAVGGLGYAGGEIADLRRLGSRAHLRREAERLATSELHDEAEPLLRPLAREFEARPPFRAAVARFRSEASDVLNDAERLRLFERQVLAPVDRAAYRLVLTSSRDIGLLTTLAPTGLLDGVLVIWRTSIMLRAIARLYGMAPGPAATLSLLRRCLRNAALAGIADVVTHAALEHAGASLLTLLSARAGQGAGNALLAARLGIEAMRQCRPLPFVAEEPPRLSQVRKALLEPLAPS